MGFRADKTRWQGTPSLGLHGTHAPLDEDRLSICDMPVRRIGTFGPNRGGTMRYMLMICDDESGRADPHALMLVLSSKDAMNCSLADRRTW